jgi:predicted permease
LRRDRDLSAALKEGSERSTDGRSPLRGRNLLVASQVALAVVLLVGSALLLRSFQRLSVVDLGFTTRKALTFEMGLPGSRYGNRERATMFHEQLLTRLRTLPGVVSVGAVAACLPLSGYLCWGETLEAEGRPTPAGQVPPVTGVRLTTPDYFRTMGIPVRGRSFSTADESGDLASVIMSVDAARAYFGTDDVTGRRIRFGVNAESPWLTIVGVAGNVRARVASTDLQRLVYLPVNPRGVIGPHPSVMSYVVHTTADPLSLAGAVRNAVGEIDPLIPLANTATLAAVISRATAPPSFALAVIGVTAVLALLLGATGVYAVVAYAVSRRSREIGVRMALGARASDVRQMVVRQGGAMVMAGLVPGLAGALLLSRLLRGMLFEVSAADPASYAGVAAVLLITAAVALYLPARRASRVNPIEVIRGTSSGA